PIALASDSPLVNIVQQTGDTVTTLEPVPLTYMPYFFAPNQFEGETGTTSGTAPPAAGGGAGAATAQKPKGTVFLPAPDPGGSMDFENNQLTSVVLVPVTDLFPLPDATNSNNT
ncbi:MAG TPA: hypothetical protein VNU70_09945, partial [Puia sp.]|nr:hypothetical protein [Puia sp.]